jgi:tyrosinase
MGTLTALAPDRSSFVVSNKVGGQITVRKDVRDMTAQDVIDFRTAVAGMAAISDQNRADNRGYQYIAGIHGVPQGLCQHGTPAFALWHRPYVQLFEQAMQDIVPSAFLPYWNWGEDLAVPQIFLDETWEDPNHGTQPNPLLAQPMNGGPPTKRQPGTVNQLKRIAAMLAKPRLDTTYDDFSPDLENPHNYLHGWVGGQMGVIGTAAYDPLFWAHHCFVEYVFCDWQDAHPGAAQPIDVKLQELVPWGVTVDQIWRYKSLGYVYKPYRPGAQAPTVEAAFSPQADVRTAPAAGPPAVASGTTVATFQLDAVDPDFNRAEVRFEGLTPPENSFEVRVFVGQPNANAATPIDDNPSFLGSQFFFGHGGCFGAPGHCDPVPRDIFDLRPPHHYDPIRVRLDVTKRLRALLAKGGLDTNAPVTLVIVDRDGNESADADLHFEGFTFAFS